MRVDTIGESGGDPAGSSTPSDPVAQQPTPRPPAASFDSPVPARPRTRSQSVIRKGKV